MSIGAKFIRVRGRIIPILNKAKNAMAPGGSRLAGRIKSTANSLKNAENAHFDAQRASGYKKKGAETIAKWNSAAKAKKQAGRNLDRLNRFKNKKATKRKVIGATAAGSSIGGGAYLKTRE